ncbi:MAG: hypothetical protein Tsb009_21020 [Planctomycetaceae bacterium]
MYFRGLHIEGFGIFQDCAIRDMPNGLIVFSGDNECGKTTLMQFFRTVLFGPPRGSKNTYPPLQGGRHGGRLELVMGDGRKILVERIDKKVKISDDSGTAKQEPSEYLLNGVDRQTYERVFAMGLEDLQGFDVLTQEGVRGRLLAAGAGLGAASVPETLKQLDRQISELLTPGGRVQRIPTLKKELTKVRSEIHELRSQASEFARVTAKRDQLRRDMADKRNEYQDLRLRQERLRQLERSRDVWIRLDAARKEIATLEHASTFPLNGLERLNGLSQVIEGLDEEKRKAEEEVRTIDEKMEQLDVDIELLKCRDDIEQLTAERQKLASAVDDVPLRQSDVDRFESDFNERLSELGTDWDEQRLADADTSVQVRQTVQQFARDLSIAEKEFEAARHEKNTAEEQHNQASELLGETIGRLDSIAQPQFIEPTELQHRRSTIRSAQSLQNQLTSTEAALHAQQHIATDANKRLERLEGQSKHSARLLPKWLPIAIIVVGILLTIPLAMRGDWLVAVVASALGFLCAILVLWLNRHLHEQAERLRKDHSEERSELQQTLKTARAEAVRLQKQRDSQSEKLDTLLDSLATPENVERNEELLAELENDVEQCSEQLRIWTTLTNQVAQQKRDAKKAAQRFKDKSDRFSEVKRTAKSLQHEWRSWLEGRGFTQGIRPDQFEVVLKAVDAARQTQKSLHAAKARLSEITGYVDEISRRLLEVSRKAQVALPEQQSGVGMLDFLTRQLDRAVKNELKHRDLKVARNAATREVDRLSKKISEKQQEKEELLLQAGTKDENEFRSRAAAHESWKELHEEISQYELEIRTIAGTEESLDEIISELSLKGPPEVAAETADVRSRIEEIEHELSIDDQEVGKLNKVLADMAVDDKLGERLLKERSLVESLSRATKRWAVLAICRSLLEKAREVYERERQPSVIQAADEFLRLMVNDRYRMISALGEEAIQLEADNLERKHELYWSSGLSDQVYLATRLGLAREFGKHSEPLPLIFDDVLVRFDATRRRTAARALLDVAAHQQVLLFSCHPEVLSAVQDAWQTIDEPRVPLACFELDHGRITRNG